MSPLESTREQNPAWTISLTAIPLQFRMIPPNEARALLLLQDNGLIKLKDGAGLTATVTDIEENPYNLDIVELEAAQVARVLMRPLMWY